MSERKIEERVKYKFNGKGVSRNTIRKILGEYYTIYKRQKTLFLSNENVATNLIPDETTLDKEINKLTKHYDIGSEQEIIIEFSLMMNLKKKMFPQLENLEEQKRINKINLKELKKLMI